MPFEQTDSAEPKLFAANGLADRAGLSRSIQELFQPIDRTGTDSSAAMPWGLDFGTGADLYGSAAYTGGRLSASALMTDEVEQKTDATKIQKPSEATTEAGVISGQTNQNEHGKAFKLAHAADRTPSGIMPALHESFGIEGELTAADRGTKPGKTQETIAETQQPATDQVLIAQAVPGEEQTGLGSDGRWHFQNPRVKPGQDIAGAIKEWIWNDAQNVPGDIAKGVVNGVWNATIAAAEALNRGENSNSLIPQGATMDYLSGIVHHPERYTRFGGTPLNLDACEKAYTAFGLGQMNLPHDLIPGLIWNELLHRKPEDAAQETKAANGEPQTASTSIGPGQIQIRNIEALAAKYPQLKQFGDPIKAAMDPVTAPFFVAAYVANEAENINNYNKQHNGEQGFKPVPINADNGEQGFKPVPINADTLSYRYNPDVYSDKNGEYRSLEPWEKGYRRVIGPLSESLTNCPWPTPEVLQRSHHLQKVREARADLGRNSW